MQPRIYCLLARLLPFAQRQLSQNLWSLIEPARRVYLGRLILIFTKPPQMVS